MNSMAVVDCRCCERHWDDCDSIWGGHCVGCDCCVHCGEDPNGPHVIYNAAVLHVMDRGDYWCCEQAYWDAHPEKAPQTMDDARA